MKQTVTTLIIVLLLQTGTAQSYWTHGPLQASADGHYLQFTDGTPFFWLGDTGWEIFHRLRKEEAEKYLENRRSKGFNVIQATVLGGGTRNPNQYGELPLVNFDPSQPNEKYFQWIDTVITMAMRKNLFIALLPSWGDEVTGGHGETPVIFNTNNAYTYGAWIGKRYAAYPNIIWVLGGDNPAVRDTNDWRPVWRAMAKGIRDASIKRAFISYHPQGNATSSSYLHKEDWLDMNMFQSGHGDGHDAAVWDYVGKDRSLLPAKPTIDAEPNYEDHPVNPWPTWNPANGYFRDYDVRKQTYRSVFAGGCGVTYGHHAVWQFWNKDVEGMNHVDRYWTAAIDRPGAYQVGYLKRLIESRSVLNRVPDQTVIVKGQGPKPEYITAFRAADSSYGMIYLPIGKTITVNGSFIAADKITAWWFNTITGKATKIGSVKKSNAMVFTPPVLGIEHDWVLVLDNPAKHFPAPGATTVQPNFHEK